MAKRSRRIGALAKAPTTVQLIQRLLDEAGRGTEPGLVGLELLRNLLLVALRDAQGEAIVESLLNKFSEVAHRFPDRVPNVEELTPAFGAAAADMRSMWSMVKYIGTTKDAQLEGRASDDQVLDEMWKASAMTTAATKPGTAAIALVAGMAPQLLERAARRFNVRPDDLTAAVVDRLGRRRGPVKLSSMTSTPQNIEQALAYLSTALNNAALDSLRGPDTIESAAAAPPPDTTEDEEGDDSEESQYEVVVQRPSGSAERKWRMRFKRMKEAPENHDPELLRLFARYFDEATGRERDDLAEEIRARLKARHNHRPNSASGTTLLQIAQHLHRAEPSTKTLSYTKRRVERAFARARKSGEALSAKRDQSGAWVLPHDAVLAVMKHIKRKAAK